MAKARRKRRLTMRRKRTLDPSIIIDYKKPDTLKRFITDRGKIIPRRISGATSKQQRDIRQAITRARFIGLLPYSVAHRNEKGFAGDLAAITSTFSSGGGRYGSRFGGDRGDRGDRGGDRGERFGHKEDTSDQGGDSQGDDLDSDNE